VMGSEPSGESKGFWAFADTTAKTRTAAARARGGRICET